MFFCTRPKKNLSIKKTCLIYLAFYMDSFILDANTLISEYVKINSQNSDALLSLHIKKHIHLKKCIDYASLIPTAVRQRKIPFEGRIIIISTIIVVSHWMRKISAYIGYVRRPLVSTKE